MPDDTPSSSDSAPQRTTGGDFRWEPPSPQELQALMPGYTIEKLLGRGGMGAVYKGVQENLDRTVAIKILPPGVEKEDPSFAERFKNEARLMAKLLHPAVVAVFDFGTTQGGQLYIAMEYVDGTDVSQMIRSQKKLPPDHALAITAHVCDALAVAHAAGIVHRDIKPANVLINQQGQVKVADFGLAKIDDPGGHGLTKTGYAMGTPDFVAPEALMLGTAVDGRADLYAVGVMLYQMLTGQIPRGAWQPASVLSPGADPRFDQIILKAMQYDREARYQSSTELRQALDIILTVPLVKQDAPAAAVVPAAEVAQVPAQRSAAQKPVAKGPPPRERGTPLPQSPAAQSGVGAPRSQSQSKAPLFIGLAAAAVIAIGAFFMFSGKKPDTAAPAQNSPLAIQSSPGTSSVKPYIHREDKRTLAELPKGVWIPIHFSAAKAEPEFYTIASADTVRPIKGSFLTSLMCQDIALRMRVSRPAQITNESVMQLRLESRGSRDLIFKTNESLLLHTLAGNFSSNKALLHARDLGTTSPVLLEVAAIGDTTYGAVEGQPLSPLQLKTELVKPGRMHLSSPGAEVTGIEFMILDGVTEDKYPDFVKASRSSLASSPPPKGALDLSKFEPGKWIPLKGLLTTAHVAAFGASVTSDGILKMGGQTVRLLGINAKDVAFRASIKRPAGLGTCGISVRNAGTAHRQITFGAEADVMLRATTDNASFPHTPKLMLPPDSSIRTPVVLELAAIGSRTFGTANGTPLEVLDVTAAAGAGTLSFYGAKDIEFSDIEVMLLDGVSEDKWPEFVKVAQKGAGAAPYKAAAVVSTPVPAPKTSPASSMTGTQLQPSSWLVDAKRHGGQIRLWGKANGQPIADVSDHEALRYDDFIEVIAGDIAMVALRAGSGGVGIHYKGDPKPQVKPLPEAASLIRCSGVLSARWLSATNDVRDWQNRSIAALLRKPRLSSSIFGYVHFIFDDGTGYIWDFKKHGFKGTPMAQLDRFSPVAFGDVVSLDGDIYEYFCVTDQGRVKAIRANQNDPKPSALWSPDLYHDAADIAVLDGMALVRRRDGSVIVGKDAKLAEPPYAPPANLPPAIGIRSGGKMAAVQQADGRWTAWGAEDALVKKVAEIGPALDLALYATDENNYFLAWIEPNNAQAAPTVSVSSSPSPPISSSPSLPTLPPELTALDDQLKKLTAERVTAVFEAEVAKLNSGYLGGLDRKIAEEKAAGHLDGVLALNAEKTLIQGVGVANSPSSNRDLASPAPCPLPADDDKTSAVLKTLRSIYRDAYAKLVVAHAANLKALTDPLDVRLQQLEADLTKKNRIADAQTVRAYREKLGGRADGPPSAAATPQTALGGPSALPPTSVIAIKDGFTNSLGMKFVPVPGTDVVMCIHETRRQDYAAYAADAVSVDATWKNFLHQGLPVGHEDNHPVAGVSWDDAAAFCTWLSQKEGRAYRLPTDQEWSYAVGIGREEKGIKDTTPELLSQQVKNRWPWGDNFPPKTKDKAGNYADMTRKQKLPALPAFDAYTDGHITTAPVMSFTPNKLGIYDLGGNMWEWVADWYSAAQTERVLRGSAFGESANFGLLSSYRHHSPPSTRGVHGFRVVVDLKAPAGKPAATPPAQTLTPTKPSGLAPFPLPVPKRPTEAGKLVMWRLDGAPLEAPAGVTALPTELTDAVDIALGWEAALALRSDGSVVAWGKADAKMLAEKPANLTDVVDVDSTAVTAVSLHANGKVSCWGSSNYDEPMPDLVPAVAIDVQGNTVLALRNDGRVFQWGDSSVRKRATLEVPAALERVIAISNAQSWSCALGADGRLTVWGQQQVEGAYDGPANSQLPKPDKSARRVYAVAEAPCGYLVGEKGDVEDFGRQMGHVSLRSLQPKVRRMSQVFCAAEINRVVFRDEKNQWHFLGHATKGPNDISPMNVPYCEKMAQDAIHIVISRSHALAIKPKEAKEPK